MTRSPDRKRLRMPVLLTVGLAVVAALAVLTTLTSVMVRNAPPLPDGPPPPPDATPPPSRPSGPRPRIGEEDVEVKTLPSTAAAPTPRPTPMPTRWAPLLAPAGAGVLTRTGGRLVAAIRDQSYYVRFEPWPGMRLARLDRTIAGKSFAFEVLPFEQDISEHVPGGFHIERAGEIVPAAIALQLEQMGYQVGMELSKALRPLRERLGDRFKIDLSQFRMRTTFSGTVRFFVTHSGQAGRYDTVAILDADVTVASARDLALYRRRIRESETVSAETLAGASERARAAATAVLSRWVGTLLGDPALEQSLIGYVRGRD
jgi:hypothetical protein